MEFERVTEMSCGAHSTYKHRGGHGLLVDNCGQQW